MKKIVYFLTVVLLFSLLGCAVTQTPKLTPLEIQQIQSRVYEASKEVVFKSVVSVFQDLGYIIKSADLFTGFITAESATSSDATKKIWFGVSEMRQTSVTAFIENLAEKTSVRLNFVNRLESSSGYGQHNKQEIPIYTPESYQVAFEKIDNAVFVRNAIK